MTCSNILHTPSHRHLTYYKTTIFINYTEDTTLLNICGAEVFKLGAKLLMIQIADRLD